MFHSPILARALLCAAPLLFVAADWPQFRGPGSRAVSPDEVPTTWDDTKNIVWKTELPGPGSSSPIVLGDRVYVTSYSGYGLKRHKPGEIENLKRHLVAVDRASGQIVWDTPIAAKTPEQEYSGFETEHGYASSTPTTDGERLYVFYGRSGVYAFDMDGELLWEADVGTGTHIWGTGTSPVVHENVLIVNASIESGSVVGLDKTTGKELWRATGALSSWGSPKVVEAPGGAEIVVLVKARVLGLDPATGEQLWQCALEDDGACSTAVSEDGIVYATSGGGKKFMLAIRAGGRGDVTQSHVVWKQDVGSNIPSPILHNGRIYDVDNRGRAVCLNAETGEIVYRERLPKPGIIYASPVAAGNQLYVVSRRRGTFVLPAADEFEVLAQNKFTSDKSQCNGSPAISDGRLFLRSDKMLYCIGDES